jgi:hypothetical protein
VGFVSAGEERAFELACGDSGGGDMLLLVLMAAAKMAGFSAEEDVR